MQIAILCSPDMMPDVARKNPYHREGREQLEKLGPALDVEGIRLERVDWRNCLHRAAEFDAVLPLFAWDYWDEKALFLQTLQALGDDVKVLNPPDLIAWNTDKTYLADLAAKGVPVLPMMFCDRVTQAQLDEAFDQFECERLVIKPRVGGGGFGLHSLERGDRVEGLDLPEPAIVQPFQQSVKTEGEITTVWFGNSFSHALRKRPSGDEFRVQSHYGGWEEPCVATEEQLDVARAAIAALPHAPVYARVDLLRGNDGQFGVIEVELVEPYLYFAMAPGSGGTNTAARSFAAALAARL